MAVQLPSKKNLLDQYDAKCYELVDGVKAWLSKQPLLVEAALLTTAAAAMGGFSGAISGYLGPELKPIPPPPALNLDPKAVATFKRVQGIIGGYEARTLAIIFGVNEGISCVLRRVRGKEDVFSSMAAGFGSGVLYTLISGMGGPDVVPAALTSGFLFALCQAVVGNCGQCRTHCGTVKLGHQISEPPAEDLQYVKTRSLLSGIGLEKYEKNFKRDMLTYATLPLLTDSALKDASIPLGARLLILDQIHRNPDLRRKE